MSKSPMQYWLDGYKAAELGLTRESCPLMWNAWPRQSWLAGFDFFTTYAFLAHEPEPLDYVPADPLGQGKNAYKRGIDIDDCPYNVNSEDGLLWLTGWQNADMQADMSERRDIWIALADICVAAAITIIIIVGIMLWLK